MTEQPNSLDQKIQQWLRDDESFCLSDDGWTVRNQSTQRKAVVFQRKHISNDSALYFKITGPVNATVDELLDLLDLHLIERQPEWHDLFIEGKIVQKISDNVEIMYMAYNSGIPLVTNRDFVYVKVRKQLSEEVGGGVLLTYRTVPHQDCPPLPQYVRGEFEAAHCFRPNPKDPSSTDYTYIQHADSKGMIPKFFTNAPQVNIMLNEIDGVRKATMKKPNK